MRIVVTFISFFIISSLSLPYHAQDTLQTENVLILRKRKSAKRIYYTEQKPIVYKSNGLVRLGLINQINFDSLLIDTTWVKYESINIIIDPNKRHFLRNGSVMFPIAGVTFAFITTFNSIINRDKPIFYREHLIPSVGLIGLGAIMWPFKTKKYKMKRKWEFMVMPS